MPKAPLLALSLLSPYLTSAQSYILTPEDIDIENGVILGYKWLHPTETKIVIPEELGVRKIGYLAFASLGEDQPKLESVVLPEGLDTIGYGAFVWNSLTDLSLPSTVTLVDSMAFEKNKINELALSKADILCRGFALNQIAKLDIPAGVNRIETDAFFANEIGELSVGEDVAYLSGFQRNKITKLRVHGNVKEIGPCAFSDNPLDSLVIEFGCETVGDIAFTGSQLDGDRSRYSLNTFSTLSLPASVKSIGFAVFRYNRQLVSIHQDEGLTSIGDYAFCCSTLDSLECPSSLRSIGVEAFWNCGIKKLSLPDGIETISERVFEFNCFDSIIVPGTVSHIDERAFAYNARIINADLQYGVRSIASNAFAYTGCQTYWTDSLLCISLLTMLRDIASDAFFHSNILWTELPLASADGQQIILSAFAPHSYVKVTDDVTYLGADSCYESVRTSYSYVASVVPNGTTTVVSQPMRATSPKEKLFTLSGVPVPANAPLPRGLYVVRTTGALCARLVRIR